MDGVLGVARRPYQCGADPGTPVTGGGAQGRPREVPGWLPRETIRKQPLRIACHRTPGLTVRGRAHTRRARFTAQSSAPVRGGQPTGEAPDTRVRASFGPCLYELSDTGPSRRPAGQQRPPKPLEKIFENTRGKPL
ncbi:hypothetical protein GCM10009800_11730 [Nocardiopsis rhodophaea]